MGKRIVKERSLDQVKNWLLNFNVYTRKEKNEKYTVTDKVSNLVFIADEQFLKDFLDDLILGAS